MRNLQPVFSHGGSGIEGWPAIQGTGVGAGNPIEISPAVGINWPMIQLTFRSTPDMTVITEISPGPCDDYGVIDANSWYDISSGGDVVVAATTKSYAIPPGYPYVRTRITAYASGILESRVPYIELPTGQKVMAQYPTLKKGGPV